MGEKWIPKKFQGRKIYGWQFSGLFSRFVAPFVLKYDSHSLDRDLLMLTADWKQRKIQWWQEPEHLKDNFVFLESRKKDSIFSLFFHQIRKEPNQ